MLEAYQVDFMLLMAAYLIGSMLELEDIIREHARKGGGPVSFDDVLLVFVVTLFWPLYYIGRVLERLAKWLKRK